MTDGFRRDGKVALVTGEAGGLGEHFAHVLGQAGARVVVAGRRQAPLQKLAHDLGAAGIDARAIAIDVTDESSIKAGFDKAQAHFGLVDIAVCSAGVATNKHSLALSPADWDQVVDVNLKGCWMIASEAARRLIDAGRPGSIVDRKSTRLNSST